MLCPSCGRIDVSPAINYCVSCGWLDERALRYLFNDRQVFNDVERERDNIVWRATTGTVIYPLYMDGKCSDGSRRSLDDTGTIDDDMGVYRFRMMEKKFLEKDFLMHDDNLHGITNYDPRVRSQTRLAMVLDGIIDPTDIKYLGIDNRVTFFGNVYAYKFPNPFSTEHGWAVGFLISSMDVIAHDVYFDNDDDSL